MATNIVCSDTYIKAFSRLDKKTQKKSLETIRLMQRSLRSDSLKIEKLNTKLEFKSARVTQDFRAIFTQSGNTVLLVYIGHHDDAYLWARNRLQGFDASNSKLAYEYFDHSKKDTFNSLEDETVVLASNSKSDKLPKKTNFNPETPSSIDASDKSLYNSPDYDMSKILMPLHSKKNSSWELLKKILFAISFFCLGVIAGIIV